MSALGRCTLTSRPGIATKEWGAMAPSIRSGTESDASFDKALVGLNVVPDGLRVASLTYWDGMDMRSLDSALPSRGGEGDGDALEAFLSKVSKWDNDIASAWGSSGRGREQQILIFFTS